MLKLDINDQAAKAALQGLEDRSRDLAGPLKVIGEYLAESTKRRFETSTAPDGSRWEPNSETAFLGYLGRFKGSYRKDGKLSAGGQRRAAGKKPLVGETRALSTTINYQVQGNELRVGSPLVYAPTHQFGAAKGEYGKTRRGAPIPWGDIPARPFLGASDEDERLALDVLQDYIAG